MLGRCSFLLFLLSGLVKVNLFIIILNLCASDVWYMHEYGCRDLCVHNQRHKQKQLFSSATGYLIT